LTVSDMPGSRAETSTSIEASASVEASGRIWSMNGHATAAAPTAPAHARCQVKEITASGLAQCFAVCLVLAHGSNILLTHFAKNRICPLPARRSGHNWNTDSPAIRRLLCLIAKYVQPWQEHRVQFVAAIYAVSRGLQGVLQITV
jgi:hypothetical protein